MKTMGNTASFSNGSVSAAGVSGVGRVSAQTLGTLPTEAPTTQAKPTKGSGGAPRGNRNAYRHGLRCGALPPRCPHIKKDLDKYRRDLEDATAALRCVVSVVDAGTINRAVRSEKFARLVERLLEKKIDEMTPETARGLLSDGERYTRERDRAVADLELDAKQLRSLYAIQSGPSGEG